MAVTPKRYSAAKPTPLPVKAPAVAVAAAQPAAVAPVAAPPKVVAAVAARPAISQTVEAKPVPVTAKPIAQGGASLAALPVKAAEPAQVRQISQPNPAEALANSSQSVAALPKAVAEDATSAFESSYAKATKSLTDFNSTMFIALRANGEAMFDFVKALTTVKSVEEAVQLQGDHARRQFESLSSQTKELATLAQKMAADASEPLKHGFSRSFSAH